MKQGDGIRRAITAFLNERQELRGTLKPVSPSTIQIHLKLAHGSRSSKPALITSTLDSEISKFSQGLCGKFGVTIRQLPNGDDHRSFELDVG